MLLSGLWHGAGYGYIVWGLLHGGYLVINHTWNTYRPQAWAASVIYARVMGPVGLVLTFVGVVLAMAFFRAPTIGGGMNIAAGMFGFNGVSLPMAIGSHLAPWLPSFVALEWTSGKGFVQAVTWTVALLAVTWCLPNTLEIFSRYAPALGFADQRDTVANGRLHRLGASLQWQPSARWATAVALCAAVGIIALGQPTEFLYWQF
jgi:hypothetical protein